MSDPRDRIPSVWKVTHVKDSVETVYLVHATSSRDAKTQVLDQLYERRHRIREPLTAEQRDRDVFGLMDEFGDWTNRKLCEMHDCSVSAQPFAPNPPYKLYTFNTHTGEMIV